MREGPAEMLVLFDMSGRMPTLVYFLMTGVSVFYISIEKVARGMKYIK